LKTFSDGASLNIWYDHVTQLVNFEASVPSKSYFSVGYGNDSENVDMIAW
jgi:hypothetical protein